MSSARGAAANRLERLLGAAALGAFRSPTSVLAAVVGLTAVALIGATRLHLDPDLANLLPRSFQSVQDLERLKERFGGIGYVVVVAQGGEPEALRRFADDVVPRLEALPAIRFVEYRRPVEFFEEHALYYLDPEDLETVRSRLAAREAWERRRRNPMYLDLEGSEPPSVEFSDLENEYAGRSDQDWIRSQAAGDYYLDPERRMVMLLAKPVSLASDLSYSREVVGEVRRSLDGLDLTRYGPGVTVALTGRYEKKVEQHDQIRSDLALASTVALLLMVGYLAVHFRRLLAVGLVMGPLVVGLSWTFGFAGLAFDALNILTGFIGAILLGLGIDHGIHLLGRYEAEHGEVGPGELAIRRTFGETGRAVSIAGITTAVGFFGLSFSEFRAFSEFGVVAAAGMVLLVTAYGVCLPALLGVAERLGWRPYSQDRGVGPHASGLPARAGRLLVVCAVAVALALVGLPSLRFDYDFAALEDGGLPSFVLDRETNRVLGYSQTPVVVMTSEMEAERAVARELRARQQRLGARSAVDFVAAGADLVPPRQEEKRDVVRRIGRILRRIKPSWLTPEQRDLHASVLRMAKAEPFSRRDLPETVLRQFQGPDAGPDDGFLLVFPGISLSDGERVSDFAEEVRGVPLPGGGTISAAGEAMILADILAMVVREAPPVLLATLVAVFVTMWLLLGSLRAALLCLAPAAVTLAVGLSLLGPVGLKLNYLNIVMIPVLFGIGVDGGAHLVTRLAGGAALPAVVGETGRAIAGAVLTTGVGFGALVLADHPGLNSLGELSVLGLAVNLLACLVALPAFLAWRPAAVPALGEP